MKKIIPFIILILSFISCNNKNTQVNNTSSQTNEKNKTIMVGIYVYDYPFGYLSNGQIGGFDYDIMNEIAKSSELEIDFTAMKFEELMPALSSKQIDIIIAGMTVTEERKKLVNFSKEYYKSSQAILVDKDNEYINTFDDLIGKRVGVINGTIGYSYISKKQGININGFDTGSSALLALKVEKLDAAVFDKVTCEHYAKNDNSIKLVEDPNYPIEDYAIAVRKEDTELLQKINDGLTEIINNGTYQQLLDKFFQ